MSLAGPGFETWVFLTLLCDFWKVTQTLYRSLVCVSHSVVSDSLQPHGLQPTSFHGELSMEFSRQEFWSGLPFPSPGDLSNPGIKPRSPALEADSLLSKPPGKPPYRSLPICKAYTKINIYLLTCLGKLRKKCQYVLVVYCHITAAYHYHHYKVF